MPTQAGGGTADLESFTPGGLGDDFFGTDGGGDGGGKQSEEEEEEGGEGSSPVVAGDLSDLEASDAEGGGGDSA